MEKYWDWVDSFYIEYYILRPKGGFAHPNTVLLYTTNTDGLDKTHIKGTHTRIGNEVSQTEEASKQIQIAEQVIDKVCPNKEYDEHEKSKANKADDDNETESFEFECWDPDGKWEIQDVYNHMGEARKQMFRVFDVEPKEQFYKLDIFERTNENFPMKIKIMKSIYVKSVMDNFRRQGHVKGGGCVKFFQKHL